VKLNAIAGERHLHRDRRLHRPIIDPGTHHESESLSGLASPIWTSS
jgi:hypothetical protein